MSTNPFLRFYNFLANMGLVIRDDPPKVIDMKGREWGPEHDGLALSLRELKRDEGAFAGVSVVMQNRGAKVQQLTVPQWVNYFDVHGLEFSAFGQQFLKAREKAARLAVKLGPGDAVETELPLSTMCTLRRNNTYEVWVSCELPDGSRLESNRVKIAV